MSISNNEKVIKDSIFLIFMQKIFRINSTRIYKNTAMLNNT